MDALLKALLIYIAYSLLHRPPSRTSTVRNKGKHFYLQGDLAPYIDGDSTLLSGARTKDSSQTLKHPFVGPPELGFSAESSTHAFRLFHNKLNKDPILEILRP